MIRLVPPLLALLLALPAAAQFSGVDPLKGAAQRAAESAKGKAKQAANEKVEKRVNTRLLAEGRKNQCTFKTDSDEFEGKCDDKVRRLYGALVDAKKVLVQAGISGFRFEVSGHTDTTGNPAKNQALSEKRAARIVDELKKKGIPASEIVAVGKGSAEPLVKPDNTPAKRARNRRYEIQARLQMP
jgi:outer membrane protein OmpA-like peptidoglycan-associated protein